MVLLLGDWLDPPEIKEGAEVTDWVKRSSVKLGGFTFSRSDSVCARGYSVGAADPLRPRLHPSSSAAEMICLMVILAL